MLQHQVEEDAPRFLVGAHVVVDQVEVGHHQPHRIGMDQHAGAQTFLEHAQQVQLVGQERVFILDRKAAVDDRVTLLDPPGAAENPFQQRFAFDMHRFQLGQEDAGQVAGRGGVAEIILHEMFDRTAPALVLVAQALGDLDLQVEGQLIRGPPGQQVQMAAHRPEEILGLHEGFEFFLREDVQLHQLADFLHAMQVFRDPEQRLQVAQPALAFLHVGFDNVALTALALMALVAFFQLGLDEFRRGIAEQVRRQPLGQLLGQRFIPGQEAVFQQRGSDGEILAPQLQAIAHRARRMANLQP